MAQNNNYKRTELRYANELLADRINFEELIPRLHYFFQRQRLNEFYLVLSDFYDYNRHTIKKYCAEEELQKVDDILLNAPTILFKKARLVQQEKTIAKQRAKIWRELAYVKRFILDRLDAAGYFKKTKEIEEEPENLNAKIAQKHNNERR